MMNESRLTNSSNGRDTNGGFTTGNKGGPGNPHAKQVAISIFSAYFLFSHLNEFLYCLCT